MVRLIAGRFNYTYSVTVQSSMLFDKNTLDLERKKGSKEIC